MDGTVTPLAAAGEGGETPRFFSLSQRIGRLRYLVYMLVGVVACALLLVLVYFVAMLLPPSMAKLVSTIAFIVVKGVVIPMLLLVFTMRRFRDLNFSGWWALLPCIGDLAQFLGGAYGEPTPPRIAIAILTLLVKLALLFIPGSKGENRFGPPPAPNHAGLRFVAIAIPLALLSAYYSLYNGRSGPHASPPANVSGPSSGPGLKTY